MDFSLFIETNPYFFIFMPADHILEKASQSRILIVLQEQGMMTQRDLTQHLQIQPGSASEILAKLEKRGLIEKEPLESDRRTARIFLTEEGSMMAAEAMQQRRELHKEMFACLSREKKARLFTLLEKCRWIGTCVFPDVQIKKNAE